MTSKKTFPWDHPHFLCWISVGRACQLMNLALARELADMQLKPPHLDILVNLYRFEGITQQELARKLLVGRSNMSMLLPQMEKRGVLVRKGDEADRRVLRLYLTDEGRELTEKAMTVQTRLIDETLRHADSDELEHVSTNMEQIISRLLARDKN